MRTRCLLLVLIVCITTANAQAGFFVYFHTNSFNCLKQTFSPLSGMAVGPTPALRYPDVDGKILRPFSTDGCSSSPDGFLGKAKRTAWIDCCVSHDMAYWLGGDKQEKVQADRELAQCIASKGYPRIGKIYQTVVRSFGGPSSIKSYRWGYGWNFKRAYAPFSESEKAQVYDLYGVTRENIEQEITSKTIELSNTCEINDIIFSKTSGDDQAVYRALNATLKRNTTIEWARLNLLNITKKQFLVKIKSCFVPVTVTLDPAGGDPQVTDLCLNQR